MTRADRDRRPTDETEAEKEHQGLSGLNWEILDGNRYTYT